MTDRPATQYATAGDIHIAYQVIGEGPDLLFVPGWVSNVELIWDEPNAAAFLRRLASFSRLMILDKRGTGLSDPVPTDRAPTLEDRMADVMAVMDAASCTAATIFGFSEGGATSALFAATYPDRTAGLIMWGATPRIAWAEDWPWGVTREDGLAQLKSLAEGRPDEYFGLDFFAPSAASNPQAAEWWTRFMRMSASPAMFVALMKTNGMTDVRSVLPSVQAPTLVLHRKGDTVFDPRGGEYLAEHIAGARYVELPGSDHWPWFGDTAPVIGEIQQFVTGSRATMPTNRILATVLVTDIVDSTGHLAAAGDQRWKEVLDAHDEMAKDMIERYGGRWIKSTGDGLIATFDGPGRAISAAQEIVSEGRGMGLEIRAGLHTGEIEMRADDISGMAVHISARVSSLAHPGEVLTTRTVRDLVSGSGIHFAELGLHELKGIPERWEILAAR